MRVPLNIKTHEMDPVISSLTTAITQTVHENKDSLQAAFVNIKASGDLNLLHSRSLESLLEAFTASIANTRNAAAKNRLSDSLKSAVIDALTSCNDASGSLFKQTTLMGPETEQKASRTFASSITSFVDAYTQLFHCYAGIIHQNEPKLQDEHLHSPNTKELAAKAHRATQEASSLQSSPENKNSPQTADISLPIRQHEDPPPYPEDRSVKVTISYGRGSPADSGNGGSSKTYDLAAPFRALAKAFCSKSQPFVPALCEAAVQGDLNNVAALISQGVNVNGTNEDGDTALDLAIQRNHLHIVSILLAAGADPTRQGRRGLPPLFKAVIKGHYEIAEMLQRYGAKPNAADVTGQPFIMDVVASGTVAGVQYLLEHGVGGNVKDITGEQAIVKAVRRGDVDMAAVLLKHGAKITAKDITGQPLLAIALENKDANMVDLLLSQGANPNGKDITGSSLLCVACGKYKKCPELVHLLLKYGANANSKTVTGTSVFSDAVTSRHLDLARCLLESGANPNATEVTGQPILITVICDKKIGQKDKVELVRLMLERGCNPNKARDFVFGEKAIDIARRAGNLEIVALLEKYS